jgi:hypothetical protein
MSAGNLTEDAEVTPAGVIEQHHVEVIPEGDRHGWPRDQFTGRAWRRSARRARLRRFGRGGGVS